MIVDACLSDRARWCNPEPSPERKRRAGKPRAGPWGSDESADVACLGVRRGRVPPAERPFI